MAFFRQGRLVHFIGCGGGSAGIYTISHEDDLLQALLQTYFDIFEQSKGLPPPPRHDHRIYLLPGTAPIAVRPYRYPQLLKDEVERQCADMLEQGTIRSSTSPFSSPVLLVKKADSSWCFCVDYRALNDKAVKDKFPILVVEELLDELRDAHFFTKIDLCSGYHQVRMHPDDIEKTAFRTHQRHFEFTVMPFGLTNAPATFKSLMNDVLHTFIHRFVLVFFGDILIYSSTCVEHLQHVKIVFDQIRRHKLFVKQSKCIFGSTTVSYLGHIISSDGVAMDLNKVTAVDSWPTPKTLRALRGFLGLTGYYRKFIARYGDIARPLMALLKRDVFCWSPKADMAFQCLKKALMTALVLQLPDFDKEFMIECDASGSGFGAVLHQGDGPIAFFSRPVAAHHAKLPAYEPELIGLVKAVRHWRPYVWG
jgi:hypothetical protein